MIVCNKYKTIVGIDDSLCISKTSIVINISFIPLSSFCGRKMLIGIIIFSPKYQFFGTTFIQISFFWIPPIFSCI